MTANVVSRSSIHVLVVDDEEPLARVVGSYLEADGFTVDLAHDGLTAVEAARAQPPALVVLDIMLPGIDGVEVCRQVRSFSDCYIIMLTARDDEMDKVVGLAVGADDYLTKPFSPRELMARVRAMMRRPRNLASAASAGGSEAEQARVIGRLTVYPTARKAVLAGHDVELTRTEFDLLDTLMSSPQRVFTRRQLIEAVWGPGWYGDEHVVDVHIGHLRRKLNDEAASPRLIRTVRGVGYGMVDP